MYYSCTYSILFIFMYKFYFSTISDLAIFLDSVLVGKFLYKYHGLSRQ